MGDQADYWRETKHLRIEESKRERADARSKANEDFRAAAVRASQHGMSLVRKSEVHYQLRCNGWMVNLYPGNGRVDADKNQKARAPYFRLPPCWALSDVVKAAIAEMA